MAFTLVLALSTRRGNRGVRGRLSAMPMVLTAVRIEWAAAVAGILIGGGMVSRCLRRRYVRASRGVVCAIRPPALLARRRARRPIPRPLSSAGVRNCLFARPSCTVHNVRTVCLLRPGVEAAVGSRRGSAAQDRLRRAGESTKISRSRENVDQNTHGRPRCRVEGLRWERSRSATLSFWIENVSARVAA